MAKMVDLPATKLAVVRMTDGSSPRKPTAMRIVSLDIRRPREETGGALSQAPECFEAAARRRALDMSLSLLDRRDR